MTTDPLAPPDRPEPTPQEKDIAQAARLLRLAAQYRLNVSGMWLSEQQVMVELAIRLEALVAVPARAHHEEKEHEMHDELARSATTEIRDRQPAAVTDAGAPQERAGTTEACEGCRQPFNFAEVVKVYQTLDDRWLCYRCYEAVPEHLKSPVRAAPAPLARLIENWMRQSRQSDPACLIYADCARELEAALGAPAPAVESLRLAVEALDHAAADTAPYGDWDAAKWKVFNAAVRFVKETDDV